MNELQTIQLANNSRTQVMGYTCFAHQMEAVERLANALPRLSNQDRAAAEHYLARMQNPISEMLETQNFLSDILRWIVQMGISANNIPDQAVLQDALRLLSISHPDCTAQMLNFAFLAQLSGEADRVDHFQSFTARFLADVLEAYKSSTYTKERYAKARQIAKALAPKKEVDTDKIEIDFVKKIWESCKEPTAADGLAIHIKAEFYQKIQELDIFVLENSKKHELFNEAVKRNMLRIKDPFALAALSGLSSEARGEAVQRAARVEAKAAAFDEFVKWAHESEERLTTVHKKLKSYIEFVKSKK